jgi:hypothetical protein
MLFSHTVTTPIGGSLCAVSDEARTCGCSDQQDTSSSLPIEGL